MQLVYDILAARHESYLRNMGMDGDMGIDLYSSESPAYRQLAQLLRARIESGELQPGQPLPSESMLWQEHGVARGTVRRAVEVLRDEGLVVTVHGRGSFVKPVA